MTDASLVWHRVAALDGFPEGRVKTVNAGSPGLALTHIDGVYTAMDNCCLHQHSLLGERTIASPGAFQAIDLAAAFAAHV